MKAVKQLLWWLVAGSDGGLNRARIIDLLKKEPSNANRLAEALGLDYKTIRHHLDVLEKNNVVTSTGNKYGKMYFLSSLLDENYAMFEEIWERIGKKHVTGEDNKEVKK